MKNHDQELEITLILNELEKDCELRPSQASYLVNYCKNQQKEIARLNKIIDELEKYINEAIESYGYEVDITDRIEKMTLNNVMRKLKELKEEGK